MCHAVGASVQQLAVNDQALRRDWEIMSMHQSKCVHFSTDISSVSCSWGQRAAAGGERPGPEASLGEQPAQHQGGLGRVDAPLCCGAAQGVAHPCPQGYPPPGSGVALQLHTSPVHVV